MSEVLCRLERCLLNAGSPGAHGSHGSPGPQAAVAQSDQPQGGDGEGEGEREGGGEAEAVAEGEAARGVEGASGGGADSYGGARRVLCGAELGEFALQLHSYLLLLDYSKGAYPTKVSMSE